MAGATLFPSLRGLPLHKPQEAVMVAGRRGKTLVAGLTLSPLKNRLAPEFKFSLPKK